MNATTEKSTARARVAEEVVLDGRLAIYHEAGDWLAASDIHYGYELSRRVEGGLFPMWGMHTIEDRFDSLIADYSPRSVILNGDIVDRASASREVIAWLDKLRKKVDQLILVAGNHDRGPVLERFDFVQKYETNEGYFFHHGHLTPSIPSGVVEVIGHLHPSLSVGDGAGMKLRLPSLVQEQSGETERWILPAFSPWAGGGKFQQVKGRTTTEWACSPKRVFPFEL